MANEHSKFEDTVPQFSGEISEKFVELVTYVKLWEAEHKEETKPRLGPRPCRRGLLGQPKQIINTLVGQGDVANFSVDHIIETLRNNGYGDSLEEEGQGALDSYFGMRRGKGEAIQDYINLEEMM